MDLSARARNRILAAGGVAAAEPSTASERIVALTLCGLAVLYVYEYLLVWNMLVLLTRVLQTAVAQRGAEVRSPRGVWIFVAILNAPIILTQLLFGLQSEHAAIVLNFVGPAKPASMFKLLLLDAAVMAVQYAFILSLVSFRVEAAATDELTDEVTVPEDVAALLVPERPYFEPSFVPSPVVLVGRG